MYTLQSEKLADVLPHVQEMLKAHWNEVEKNMHGPQEYSLDIKKYQLLESLGMLHISTIRADGKIYGYASFVITPCYHMQNKLVATLDGLFLDPIARQGFTGLALLRKAEKSLKKLGAKFVQYSSPMSKPCDPIYKRLGAKHTENIYHKEL